MQVLLQQGQVMAPHVVVVGQEEHPPPLKTSLNNNGYSRKILNSGSDFSRPLPCQSSTLGCTGLTMIRPNNPDHGRSPGRCDPVQFCSLTMKAIINHISPGRQSLRKG